MEVRIKKFDVNMVVKTNGIEFEVRTPDGRAQKGDCYLTMSGLVWCKGKITKTHGVKISWEEFSEILESSGSLKAALKAAKAAVTEKSKPNR